MTDSAHRDVEALANDALYRRVSGWGESEAPLSAGQRTALDALLARLEQVEQQLRECGDSFIEVERAATTAMARLEQVERERDEYRFWNERVRVCEKHTQDVAAPVGDCLICNLEQVEQERDAAVHASGLESMRCERAEAELARLREGLIAKATFWEENAGRFTHGADTVLRESAHALRVLATPTDTAP